MASPLRIFVTFGGLFVSDGQGPEHPPRFVALAPPTDQEVQHLLAQIVGRTERHLRKRGRLDDDAEAPELSLELFASQPLPRPGRRGAAPEPKPPPLCARQAGFSVHAGTWIRASDRDGLERLCRYGLRPPLFLGRLEALPDGSYAYGMKRRFSDGREVLTCTAEALLLRLIGLIPPPRVHLVRYAGIFASRARARNALTGRRRRDEPAASSSAEGLALTRVDLPTLCQTPRPNDPARPRRLDRATLLRRTFAIDVRVCRRCQGPMRLIGVVEAPAVIRRILTHLGLRAAPARAGPRLTVRAGRSDMLLETFDGLDPPAPVD